MNQITTINLGFLSPYRVLLISCAIYFALLPLVPLDVHFPLSLEAIVFWMVCFGSYLFGLFISSGNQTEIEVNYFYLDQKKLSNFIFWLVMIGFFGAILQIIEKFVFRGVSVDMNALEQRTVLEHTQSSLFSVVAAVFGSVGLLSFINILSSELGQVHFSRKLKIFSMISAVLSLWISIQLGSRTLVLVLFMTYLLVWVARARRFGRRLTVSKMLILGTLVILLAVGFAWMMILRLELMRLSITDSVLLSTYAYTITPENYILDSMESYPQLAVLFGALFSLLQYVFHGIYEFGLLFDSFSGEHELGNQVLWLPVKFVSSLLGKDFSVGFFENYGVREGIFTTFVGPYFIDFGWLSPIPLFLTGFLFGLPYRLLIQGEIQWLPTVTLIATICVLWPIVNILISATGMYLLAVSLVIGFVGKRAFLNTSQAPQKELDIGLM